MTAGTFAAPDKHGVLRAQAQPPGLCQHRRGFPGLIVHECVELLHADHQDLALRRRDRLSGAGAPPDAPGVDVRQVVAHQRAHRGGVVGQIRRKRAARGQERVELSHRAYPLQQRGPGHLAGLEDALAEPLQACPQPRCGEPGEADRLASSWFMVPLRDPRVFGRPPHLTLPPFPGVIGRLQRTGVPLDLTCDAAHRGR